MKIAKKAQMIEGMEFLIGTLIVFLLMLITIYATILLIREEPQIIQKKFDYAVSMENFNNKLFLSRTDEFSLRTLQAFLNTEKEFPSGKKTIEKALKEGNRNEIVQYAKEVFQKSIDTATDPSSHRECYYFKAEYVVNNNVDNVIEESVFMLRNYDATLRAFKDKEMKQKAAIKTIKTEKGEIRVYLYLNPYKGSC